MLKFIGNTLIIFLSFIFIAIPLGLIAFCLLLKYLMFCGTIAGGVGILLGCLLLIAMMFSALTI